VASSQDNTSQSESENQRQPRAADLPASGGIHGETNARNASPLHVRDGHGHSNSSANVSEGMVFDGAGVLEATGLVEGMCDIDDVGTMDITNNQAFPSGLGEDMMGEATYSGGGSGTSPVTFVRLLFTFSTTRYVGLYFLGGG
jgi:hypothetical protein